MRAILLRPDEAPAWREATEWHFASFCEDGKWTADELWDEVKAGTKQMWLAFDGEAQAVALTHIVPGHCKTCVITHCAGHDMARWWPLIGSIEAWARTLGCVFLEAVTRPGWEKVLKDMRKTHVILEKRL